MEIGVQEAEDRFCELIDRAMSGERIIIRKGEFAVQLSPVAEVQSTDEAGD